MFPGVLMRFDKNGCQNEGPFLGTLNIGAVLLWGPKKGPEF